MEGDFFMDREQVVTVQAMKELMSLLRRVYEEGFIEGYAACDKQGVGRSPGIAKEMLLDRMKPGFLSPIEEKEENDKEENSNLRNGKSKEASSD